MDVFSMLNTGSAPAAKSESQTTTSEAGRSDAARPHPVLPVQPPSAMPYPTSSHGLTPLQTSSHVLGGSQYPFPQQQQQQQQQQQAQAMSQSPVHQQYRTQDTLSRPPSLGHPYTSQASPSPFASHTGITGHHQPQASSLSPPPPTRHSHTPLSSHQSPVSTSGHLSTQIPPPYSHHHSQPSTPLNPPPPPLVQRTSLQYDSSNLPHHRTLSNTPSSVQISSPAQHHPSIGNLLDSPSTNSRPAPQPLQQQQYPQHQNASDYRSSVERERSLSVSPKTKVPPRAPSFSSQRSSQQDMHSTRTSIHTESQGHAAQSVAGSAARLSNSAHGLQDGRLPSSPPVGGPPTNRASQSAHVSPQIQHHPQRVGMDHLTASANHHSPANDISAEVAPASASEGDQMSYDSPSSHNGRPQSQNGLVPHAAQYQPAEQRTGSTSTVSLQGLERPAISNQHTRSPLTPATDISNAASLPNRQPLKRPAETFLAAEPATKRGRRKKYLERPIWASLAPQNPLSRGQSIPNSAKPAAAAQQRQPQVHVPQEQAHPLPPQPPRPAAPGLAQPRSSSHYDEILAVPAWRQDPPLDRELLRARKILGAWEKSYKFDTPIPSMVKSLMDWFYVQLEACGDVGNDPLEGSIEIEAKIGTLVNVSDRQRCSLPVTSATLIHPSANRHYAFESQMNEVEHQKMNTFLNTVTRESHEKGRVPMRYEHIREIDSFRSLSETGLRSLPACAHRRPTGRELKLRTTTQVSSGAVTARIVKIPLGDIHIFNPNDPYDCRISMNLEVNLNRPGFDPETLSDLPTMEKPAAPDRKKDRMSYKHLAYSIDLTRVDVKDLAPKFELELELDAKLLRQQLEMLKSGQENALSNVVEGFLDNVTFLMRQRQ